MPEDTLGISCCFDEESTRMLADYRKKGPGPTAKVLLSALSSRGFAGATVLELGCGFGALTLALIRGGAVSGVGIDLSPKMVETARALAAEAGLSGSTSFKVGDGAKDVLVRSDVVILDTVVCCYPDFGALIDNSSSASERYYAISIPDDRRLLTRIFKVFLPLQRVFFRRGTFRFFIHPVRAIVQRLVDKGFQVVFDGTAGRTWSVLIFAVPSS